MLDREEQQEQERGLQKILAAVQEEKTSQHNETLNALLSKLGEMQSSHTQPDPVLTEQLHSLRGELEELRTAQAQRQQQTSSVQEERIRELQRVGVESCR